MSLKLRKVVLLKEMSLSDVWRSEDPADRFDAPMRDTFKSDVYQLSRDGDDVTITGNVGTAVVPWSSVSYVVPEKDEPKPVVSTGKAGKR